jgi:hypothetical protein
MTEDRQIPPTEQARLTPWIGRLMAANAVVLVLLQTVFTAPVFVDVLQFQGAHQLTRHYNPQWEPSSLGSKARAP